MDDLKNFAITSVATPPTPATTGLSLVVAAGTGASLPVAPFNMVVWPLATQPIAANAEIVRVTARATDTLTITRAQEGSTARAIVAGDQISANVTRKTLTDLVPTDSVVAAATRIVANMLAASDTQPAFRILGDGTHQWGLGGTTAIDTALYRSAAYTLRVSEVLEVSQQLNIGVNNNAFLGMKQDNARIYMGVSSDTSLYRSAANALKTDGSFSAGGPYFMTAAVGGQGAGVRYLGGGGGATSWYMNAATGGNIYMAIGETVVLTVGTSVVDTKQTLTFSTDTNLYRASAGNLKTDGTFQAAGSIVASTAGAGAIYLRNDTGHIYFGVNDDTNLYRSSAGVLKTDSFLDVQSLFKAQYGRVKIRAGLAEEINIGDRAGDGVTPYISFGSAGDTNLYRSGASTLKTDSSLQVAQTIYAMPTNANGFTYYPSNAPVGYNAFSIVKQGDTQFRWLVADTGTISWGAGGTTAPDTNLYRAAANTLKTDSQFYIVGNVVSNAGFYSQTPSNTGAGFLYNPGVGGGTAFYSITQGEANPKFYITDNGSMWFGAGGASTVDTNFYRSAAMVLTTNSSLRSAADLAANFGNVNQVWVGHDGGAYAPRIMFGNAFDTNLYRSAANYLKTDSNFSAAAYYVSDTLAWYKPAAGYIRSGDVVTQIMRPGAGQVMGIGLNTDTTEHLRIDSNGRFDWGPGNAAVDTGLFRYTTNWLVTNGAFWAGWNAAVGIGNISVVATGDGWPRVGIYSNGQIIFGPGTAGTDTVLYRAQANTLRTDGEFWVGSNLRILGSSQLVLGPDTSFYRSAAGVIRTDSILHIGPGSYLSLNNGNPGIVQVEFGWNGSTRQYRHVISTSHDGGNDAGNFMDFKIWTVATPGGADGVGTYRTLRLDGAGKLIIGNALDTSLYRTNTNQLATAGDFIVAQGTSGIGAGSRLYFSSAADVWLYRSAAGTLKTDGNFAIAGVQNGGHPYAKASATSSLALTVAMADIVGATLTLPTAGTYIIIGSFDFQIITVLNLSTLLGVLIVNGVQQTEQVVFTPTTDGNRIVITQTWIVPVGAGQIVKLQAGKPFAGPGNNAQVMDQHTTLRAFRIDA